MQVITKKQSRAIAVILAVLMLLSCFSFIQGSAYAASKGKRPYKSGDNIKNAVFYIAIDADNNGSIQDEGDKVYYYTLDEIKNFSDEVKYHYGNHGEGETSTVRGAKLSSMLENLQGFEINSTTEKWKIQYAEEDAFHASDKASKDTVKGLTDKDGDGNASGVAMPAETIIGYECKMTYDKPDANNVNDTKFNSFTTFVEASLLRAYRQTNSANTSVLKNFMGVVISESGASLSGKSGYTIKALSDDDGEMAVADDHEVSALMEGMKWPVRPQSLAYAKLSSINSLSYNGFNGVSSYVTAAADTSKVVKFYYTESPYFIVDNNGKTSKYLRSDLIEGSETTPSASSDPSNKPCYGYYQPMFYRYQGQLLSNLISPKAGQKVYLTKENGTMMDITSKIDKFFVAFSNTQSKKSSNQVEYNRKVVNYSSVKLVDLSTAQVVEAPLNEGGAGSIVESGKVPVSYDKASIVISNPVAVPAGLKAATKSYNTANLTWNRVSGASGYVVYQSTRSNGTYKAVKTITAGSTTKATVSGLKTGTNYYFKIKAYKNTVGGKLYSNYSAVKSAKPVLTKGVISKTTKIKKSKATVTWKKVAGASKYQLVYGQNKKITKGKKSVTTKSTKTTLKKLKKGKSYYVKVRAYRVVDGKRIYGPYSAVKRIK